jgi:NAD dependent epimerase/dehydratase family enzyme
MDQPRISGPVHVAAPEVVTNRQFTASLTKVLRRPAILPVPVFLLYLLYGKAAKTLIEGRGAIPGVLMDNGFHYQFPELRPALADLFGSRK